jgi:nucleotide-binding universal stress UspA family protein
MLIVHLTHTPLAGAPIRIARATELHEGVRARVCTLDPAAFGTRTFDEDLVWARDRDEVIDLVERCDVLHLHNFFDLESTQFLPIDFGKLWRAGKPMVRQFHAGPALVARFMGRPFEAALQCPIPKLVCGQWQERWYPNARPVPLVVFPPDELPRRAPAAQQLRISYAPSLFRPARAERWDTKGYPETVRMLRRVARQAQRRGREVMVDIIEQVPHRECLERKALAHIAIDELVTGSYHTSTLESLAAGSATLSYLDGRTQASFMRLAGQYELPVLNVGLEHAEALLLDLVGRPDVVEEIGLRSARWMAEHWGPEHTGRHFMDAYREVIAHPSRAFAARFDDQACDEWLNKQLYDVLWSSRSRLWPMELPPWWILMRGYAGRALRGLGLRKS